MPPSFTVNADDIIFFALCAHGIAERDDYRRATIPVKAVGFGKSLFELGVEPGNEFGDTGLASDGIYNHNGEVVASNFCIFNPLKDSCHTARKRFGIGEASVKVAAGSFEPTVEVVEEIGDDPDECGAFESVVQSACKCTGRAFKVIASVAFEKNEIG